MRFEGKVAVITGGARGLGSAFADAIVAEGAKVALLDVDEAEVGQTAGALEKQGFEALGLRCDVRDEHEVEAVVARVAERFGRIDFLINSAALHRRKYNQPFKFLPRDEVRALFDVNVMGILNCCLAVRPVMATNGGGSIVNLTSTAGHTSVTPYGVSKLAARGLTLALAGDGSLGGDQAAAFIDGLHRCDVAAYGGHARYGTGPDFDYNFTADLIDDDGSIVASFSAYKDLVEELSERARAARRSALAEYRRLVQRGALVIHRVNGGNLVVNLRNYHSGELGSHLMIDQLRGDPAIRRFSREMFAPRRRLWLLSGCRTHDYFYNLRTLSPTINAGGLDLFGTRRLIYWSHMARTLLAFIDAVLARASCRGILDALSAQNPPRDPADGESHVALPWLGA